MHSLIGIWKLVEARSFGDEGQELAPPLGPQPMGIVFFAAERMVGVIADARAAPPPEGSARPFIAYTGTFRFDGTTLVTKADDASRPELMVEQVRSVRFDGPNRIMVIPTSGVPGYNGMNTVWERVS